MKSIFRWILVFFLFSGVIVAKGEWEIGLHYSYWSINFAKPLIEDSIDDTFDNFDSSKGDILFDSNGNNYGVEIRYYPSGKHGSFSVGFSYEKNNFKGELTGSYSDADEYGNQMDVNAAGQFNIKPHSFNLSLRWDIAPKSKIHPFFGFGLGIGNLEGDISLTTTTNTYIDGTTITKIDTEEKTIKDMIDEYEEEEEKKFPIGFIPIVYLSFGIKGEIIDNLYILGEVAIYNGLIFRGGLAFKF